MTATRATPVAAEAGLEELRMLHALNREVDSLIEECIREQCSLAQTFQRLLPAVLRELGAQGLAVAHRPLGVVTNVRGALHPGIQRSEEDSPCRRCGKQTSP